MTSPLLTYFAIQRGLFGVCPNCAELFRVSETRVFLRAKPKPDWVDLLDHKAQRLDNAEENLVHTTEALRERAGQAGRRQAMKQIRKVDPIFTPRRLNPDDAKVIFHPVDYLVFDGMKSDAPIRRVLLLDRQGADAKHRALQRSIETAISKRRVDWKTLHVQPDGSIVEK